jgi:hypothetical protein
MAANLEEEEEKRASYSPCAVHSDGDVWFVLVMPKIFK